MGGVVVATLITHFLDVYRSTSPPHATAVFLQQVHDPLEETVDEDPWTPNPHVREPTDEPTVMAPEAHATTQQQQQPSRDLADATPALTKQVRKSEIDMVMHVINGSEVCMYMCVLLTCRSM